MSAPKQVAIAILYQADRYLLQLRDPLPTIVYPGEWGLFGGHLETDETPEEAVWREIQEEISYRPPALTPFTRQEDESVVRHVFEGELTVPLTALNLQEGWDFGLLTLDEIQKGEAYSPIAQKVCPVGSVHRQLLLDFQDRRRQGKGALRSP